jgi:hypothetical protein
MIPSLIPHRHATNAVHVAAFHVAPFAGRHSSVVAFTFGLLQRSLINLPAVAE